MFRMLFLGSIIAFGMSAEYPRRLSSDHGGMQIFVRLPTGTILPVDVAPTANVNQVVQALRAQRNEELPVHFNLEKDNAILSEDAQLSDLAISAESTINALYPTAELKFFEMDVYRRSEDREPASYVNQIMVPINENLMQRIQQTIWQLDPATPVRWYYMLREKIFKTGRSSWFCDLEPTIRDMSTVRVVHVSDSRAVRATKGGVVVLMAWTGHAGLGLEYQSFAVTVSEGFAFSN